MEKITVKIKFSPYQVHGLTTDRFFRVIWCIISLDHIRDQYFVGQVWDFVDALREVWPVDRPKFIQMVRTSPLVQYGQKRRGVLDIDYWLRIYDRLYYKGDVELLEV